MQFNEWFLDQIRSNNLVTRGEFVFYNDGPEDASLEFWVQPFAGIPVPIGAHYTYLSSTKLAELHVTIPPSNQSLPSSAEQATKEWGEFRGWKQRKEVVLRFTGENEEREVDIAHPRVIQHLARVHGMLAIASRPEDVGIENPRWKDLRYQFLHKIGGMIEKANRELSAIMTVPR